MRGNPGLRTRLLIGGLAATGVVAAHSLAFVLASPDVRGRAELLGATGHRDFSKLVAVALGLVAAGLLRFAAGRAWGPRADVSGRRLYAVAAPRLLVLQVGGFLLLEATERAMVGLAPAHVFAEPAVAIGLFIQVIAALAGAGLLVLFAKTFARLFPRRHVATAGAKGLVSRPISRLVPARFEVGVGSGTLRGPPLPQLH